MTKRNLTVQLDAGVIRSAKVIASQRGTSVSALVAHQIGRMVESDARYQDAWRTAAAALRTAAPRGGRSWRREELHER